MRSCRKFIIVLLSVIGLLSTAFAAPTYAFQDANADDGQWCIEDGGIWDGTNCQLPEQEPPMEEDDGQWCIDGGGKIGRASCRERVYSGV